MLQFLPKWVILVSKSTATSQYSLIDYVFVVGVGLINRQRCEQAVLEVTGQGRDGTVKLFDVISAFDAPRYVYDREQQKFIKWVTLKGQLQLVSSQIYIYILMCRV